VNFGLRRFEEMRPPVISDLSASNRLNRSLGRLRGAILQQRRATLALGALLVALAAIGACSTLPG
jgi:hypothetical protein